jgi:hypothetical protein
MFARMAAHLRFRTRQSWARIFVLMVARGQQRTAAIEARGTASIANALVDGYDLTHAERRLASRDGGSGPRRCVCHAGD